MFARATKDFLREVDPDGSLIAVKNLNDSDKLQLLSLVIKKKRFWCWQKPKYEVLAFTLEDVLTGDHLLRLEVTESNFVKYESNFENCLAGNMEAALQKTVKVKVRGRDQLEGQSSFGILRKQEVDLTHLIRDTVGRKINLEDLVLQQVMEGRKGVLCILTEKIMTSQKCVISEHELMEASCGGMLETQTQILQVSSTEDENLVNDSNVVLEIPAPTTIAFSVTELYVKLDGQFDICFLQGRHGGFEEKVKKKCSHKKFMFCRVYPPSDIVDKLEYGECFPDGPLNALRQDTLHLEKDFYPFVELPGEQQTTLKNILQAALSDDELLMVMETVFDDMARDLSPPMALVEELTPPQQEHIRTLLELVGCSLQGEGPGQEDAFSNPELFSTAHLLVSALAELPDNATALLGTCWKLQMVPMLCHLLCTLSDDGKCDLEDPNLAPLKDEETFGTVQHLLALTDISLERLQSSVNVVILKDWNVLPKILTISLNGLCALEHRTNAITQ